MPDQNEALPGADIAESVRDTIRQAHTLADELAATERRLADDEDLSPAEQQRTIDGLRSRVAGELHELADEPRDFRNTLLGVFRGHADLTRPARAAVALRHQEARALLRAMPAPERKQMLEDCLGSLDLITIGAIMTVPAWWSGIDPEYRADLTFRLAQRLNPQAAMTPDLLKILAGAEQEIQNVIADLTTGD